jgi:hypothetical protein
MATHHLEDQHMPEIETIRNLAKYGEWLPCQNAVANPRIFSGNAFADPSKMRSGEPKGGAVCAMATVAVFLCET